MGRLIFSGVANFVERETGASSPAVAGSSDGPLESIAGWVAEEAAEPESVESLGGASAACISDENKGAVAITELLTDYAEFPLNVEKCKQQWN